MNRFLCLALGLALVVAATSEARAQRCSSGRCGSSSNASVRVQPALSQQLSFPAASKITSIGQPVNEATLTAVEERQEQKRAIDSLAVNVHTLTDVLTKAQAQPKRDEELAAMNARIDKLAGLVENQMKIAAKQAEAIQTLTAQLTAPKEEKISPEQFAKLFERELDRLEIQITN